MNINEEIHNFFISFLWSRGITLKLNGILGENKMLKMLLIVVLSITLTGCKSNKPEEISNSAAPIVPSGAIAIVTPVPTPIPQEKCSKGLFIYRRDRLAFFY
ncbi:hypothetical protein ACFSQ7_33420 [Paenibacillus rhizoplanae]